MGVLVHRSGGTISTEDAPPVEREFGRLKHDYGVAPLRVRGLQPVALHTDVVLLARLASALARARAVPLAA